MTAPAPETRATGTSVIAEVRDLRVHFQSKAGRVHAVDGVSFDIRDGETLGLVGETGCGKSVTARSFLRLVPMPPGVQAGGQILFRPHAMCDACGGHGCATCHHTGRAPVACPVCNGTGCATCEMTGEETIDLLALGEKQIREIRGNRIAMIFQDPGKALNPALSVRDQVGEVFVEHRMDELLERSGLDGESGTMRRLLERRVAYRSRLFEKLAFALPPLRGKAKALARGLDGMVEEALADTQIPNPAKVMDRYPHELSGGMRQRVMISQALACNPDLLIADEPTTALDVTVQARIIELIRELQERTKTSVLYISHDLSLVRRVCDRVAVMYAGQIAEISDADGLFADPQHPYTKGLLGAIPSSSHERGALAAIDGTVPELIDPEPGCRFATRCTFATEVCASADPVLSGGADHQVACFIHHAGIDGADMPSFDRRTS
ncbi:MAG: ABC transporter ATP-binding protein [Acidimicrobiia bacterium]|nr:ABC transporter ATP-binding protein [Acidimicrobiia bacterium]